MPATSDDGRHVCSAIGEPSSISPLRTVQFRSAGTRHSALRRSAPAVPGVPSCDRWLIANRVFITSSSHPAVATSKSAPRMIQYCSPLSVDWSIPRSLGLSNIGAVYCEEA